MLKFIVGSEYSKEKAKKNENHNCTQNDLQKNETQNQLMLKYKKNNKEISDDSIILKSYCPHEVKDSKDLNPKVPNTPLYTKNLKINNFNKNIKNKSDINNGSYVYNSKYKKKNNLNSLSSNLSNGSEKIQQKRHSLCTPTKELNYFIGASDAFQTQENNTSETKTNIFDKNGNNTANRKMNLMKSRSRHRPMITQSRQAILHRRSPTIESHYSNFGGLHSRESSVNGRISQNTGSFDHEKDTSMCGEVHNGANRGSFKSQVSASSVGSNGSSVFNDLDVFTDQMMDLCYDDDELNCMESYLKEEFRRSLRKDDKSNEKNIERKYSIKDEKKIVKNKKASSDNDQKIKSGSIPQKLLTQKSVCIQDIDYNNNNLCEDLNCQNSKNIDGEETIHKENDMGRILNFFDKYIKELNATDKKTKTCSDLNQQSSDTCPTNYNKKISYTPSSICDIVGETKAVVLKKRKDKKKLGFTVIGGCESKQGWVDLHIKSIMPDGLAAESSTLKRGDRLVSINDHCLVNVSHYDGVNLIKEVSKKSKVIEITVAQSQLSNSTKKKQSKANDEKVNDKREQKTNVKNIKRSSSCLPCDKIAKAPWQTDLTKMYLLTKKFDLLTQNLTLMDLKKRSSLESTEGSSNTGITSSRSSQKSISIHHDKDSFNGSNDSSPPRLPSSSPPSSPSFSPPLLPSSSPPSSPTLSSKPSLSSLFSPSPSSPSSSSFSVGKPSPIFHNKMTNTNTITENHLSNSIGHKKDLNERKIVNIIDFEELKRNGWVFEEC